LTRLALLYELAARLEKRADQTAVMAPVMQVDDIPARVTTPYGFHLCGPSHNAVMLAAMRLSGSHPYEPLVSLLALYMTRAGGTFIDIGANIGYFSLLVARNTGGPLRVHALEPLPENFRWVRENVAANGLGDDIMAYAVAAGAAAGEASMSSYGTGASLIEGWDGGKGDEQPKVLVPVRRLDDLFAPDELPGPITIKMDVEGYESEAVKGAPRLLASESVRCVLMELGYGLNDDVYNTTARDTLARMADHGYLCYGHHSPVNGRVGVEDVRLWSPDDPEIQNAERWPTNWAFVRPDPTWDALVSGLRTLYGMFCSTGHRTVAEIRRFLDGL
jgi:FkbM family methyltransferase